MKTTTCRHTDCAAEIVFLKTSKGSHMPVDFESLTDEDVELLNRGEELEYRWGQHTSHFSTCSHADYFRKRK